MEPKKRPTFAELCSNIEEISGIDLIQFDRAAACPSQPVSATANQSGSTDNLTASNVSAASLTASIAIAATQSSTCHLALRHFNQKLSFHNQKSRSEQSLDLLKIAESKFMSPTAKVIGTYMTKEDPLYEPAPANTNPFASNAQLSAGRKIVASDLERQQMFELSRTLPVTSVAVTSHSTEENNNNAVAAKHSLPKHSHSLPDHHGIVQRAIAQFNAQISSSQNYRNSVTSPMDILYNSYTSTNSSIDSSLTDHDYARHNNKQRNLKCAMLFCGLDLIQMHRASSSELSDTYISTDLESEFQDDLEDVLRQSKWDSEDLPMSPDADSVFSDIDSEWWFSPEQTDPAARRYLHPTLVEKRKQLRRVESRQKEKLEQLQIKLEQLRLSTKNIQKKKH